VLLSWDDKDVEGLTGPGSRSTFQGNVTGWSKDLNVTADGQGIVSHAGLALLRAVADKTGVTSGLSRALATPRLLVHDRGRVLADLAAAIADGAEVISDFRVLSDQGDLFGLVASVPTAWRALNEIAAGGRRQKIAIANLSKDADAGPERRRDRVRRLVLRPEREVRGRHPAAADREPARRAAAGDLRPAQRCAARAAAAAGRLPGARVLPRTGTRGCLPRCCRG